MDRKGFISPILIAVLALVIAVGGVGIGLAWRTNYLDKWLPLNVKDFLGRVPPVVSSVEVKGITENEATIFWQTSEEATAQAEYGTSADYGSQTPEETVLSTSHMVTLGGLTRATPYHFRVKSKDAHGNLTVSEDYTFTTKDLTKGWKTLKNEKYGYEIKYPSKWLIGGGKGTLAQSSPLAYFFVKREDMEHEGGEIVLIAVQAEPGGIPDPLISLKRCKEECNKDCTKEECDEDDLFCIEGCKAERKSITIGGVRGEQVGFLVNGRLSWVESAVAQSGTASHPPRVYFFTFHTLYKALEEKAVEYREIYDLMLSTFKFL